MAEAVGNNNAASADAEKPNTRPLNSFFAYRAYYMAIFEVIQQKERSILLRQLWKAPDPFQNKWALIAKAYSIIRKEQGRSLSNVQDFLAVTCPFMKIIPPHEYLDKLGYVLYQPDEDNEYHTLALENESQIEESLRGSNKSILDIVKNAIKTGYVKMNADQILEKAASHVILMYQQGVDDNSDPFPNLEFLLSMIPDPTPEEQQAVFDEILLYQPGYLPIREQRGIELTPVHQVEGTYPYNNEFSPQAAPKPFSPYDIHRWSAYNVQDEIVQELPAEA